MTSALLRLFALLLSLPLLAACATDPSGRSRSEVAARAKIAKAKFEEHCKCAGEKITRTVEGVEGVFLLQLRPQETNFSRQFDMDDPYGSDGNWASYIPGFLRAQIHHPERVIDAGDPRRLGYLYVDALDYYGKRYRYTGSWDQPWLRDKSYGEWVRKFVLNKELATGPAPRYGVTYDDISTHEDREYWIAGSSLRVIDLQTNEVIAERIGYMWDPAQGNDSGGRSPWLMAANYACPGFQRNKLRPTGGHAQQSGQTEDFVEQVLIPKPEN